MNSLRNAQTIEVEDVDIWQQAHRLALAAYKTTGEFPFGEHDALAGQIRRAAMAVPASVAEGFGRSSERELRRRLSIAQGSVSEVFALCLLARDLGLISLEMFDHLHAEAKMVSGLLQERRGKVVQTHAA